MSDSEARRVVYAITKVATGPAGHGEPGSPYLALATKGNSYELGTPYPVYLSREAAERKRLSFDRWGFYKVTELELDEQQAEDPPRVTSETVRV